MLSSKIFMPFVLAVAALQAHASTLTVSGFTDNGSGSCSATTPCSSLRSAITSAQSGDIIQLPSGTYSVNSAIVIDKNLTIEGSGNSPIMIDGGGNTRVMESSANTLVLKHLQIQQGASSDGAGGAGLLIRRGQVVIEATTFTNNTSTIQGGAIQNDGDLSIIRSTFFKNYAPLGAAINNSSSLSISYSTLVDNRSLSANATGAVNNSGQMTSEGSLWFNTQNCSGTGSTLSNGYNAVATSQCQFDTGNLTPDNLSLSTRPVGDHLTNSGQTSILQPLTNASEIIDQGPSTCSGTDQVGTQVPQHVRCDIGAVEVKVTATTTTTGNNGGEEGEGEGEEGGEGSEGIGSIDWLLPFLFMLVAARRFYLLRRTL